MTNGRERACEDEPPTLPLFLTLFITGTMAKRPPSYTFIGVESGRLPISAATWKTQVASLKASS